MSNWAALRGYISDTVVRALRIDASTHTLMTISYQHHEIHSGSGFRLSRRETLASPATLSFSFKTPPSGDKIHLLTSASSSGAAYIELLEGATVTNGTGTNQAAMCANRELAATSAILSIEASPTTGSASRDATITADGLLLSGLNLGAGQNKTSGNTAAREEWVLAFNTIYAIRVTSGAAGNVINLELDWYEHTDKD